MTTIEIITLYKNAQLIYFIRILRVIGEKFQYNLINCESVVHEFRAMYCSDVFAKIDIWNFWMCVAYQSNVYFNRVRWKKIVAKSIPSWFCNKFNLWRRCVRDVFCHAKKQWKTEKLHRRKQYNVTRSGKLIYECETKNADIQKNKINERYNYGPFAKKRAVSSWPLNNFVSETFHVKKYDTENFSSYTRNSFLKKHMKELES